MQRTDAELVTAACLGEVGAFRELFERHYRLAVGIAHSRLADRHLAEDAAQEAFATACRRLAWLRNRSRFPEWLGTISRRIANRMARTRKNHAPVVDDLSVSWGTGGDRDQTIARVQQALSRLSAVHREVVVLHYFSGLSYEEIGCALKITPGSVHGRLQRARRQLATDLSRTVEGEMS